MDLKDSILSATTGVGTSQKTNKPYTYADIVFRAENGTVIRKRVFLHDFEKQLLGIKEQA
ncbi:MAG: hypothetical protein FWE38_01690 [Firmicutes bacterium]|nr:hypothetical protein [Bacillota bacterium]